ncbi:MAG: DUF1656 domain-containing protein [Candidatus Saccharibacteria bacterium]|nr:DUF1656 domain-containing protein [Moraxellaceae bacterium]
MIAEVNIFGVYVSAALFAAAIAAVFHILIRRFLQSIGFYRFVFHQNLFDVALFIILWGVMTLSMSTFATSLSTVLS